MVVVYEKPFEYRRHLDGNVAIVCRRAVAQIDTVWQYRYPRSMAGRTTLNVSLTPTLSEFVATTVASGRYLSASEVVREGLRLLEERELLRQTGLEQARKKIAAGLASLDRGEGIAGEEVFAEMETRLSRLEKGQSDG